MNQRKKPLNKKGVQLIVSAALGAIVIGLIGYLSLRFKIEADWTSGGRNTLTPASQKLLAGLPGPVSFTIFDYPTSDTRPVVEMWVDRYKRFKPDVKETFVDPGRDPLKVKQFNIQQPGEVVLEYQGRHENLTNLSEATITGALQRLSDSGDHYVVFLEGHGERATIPTPGAEPSQNDFTLFAQALRDKGLKVQPINLVKTPKIPDNTSVLVIASPTQTLVAGEAKLVDDYVKAGGNLLWLADPEHPAGLDAVAKTLGIEWQNGFAVFPDYQKLGTGSPGIYLSTDYPPNPVTDGFTDITAFPLIRSLDFAGAKAAGWTATPLLTTSERSWLETGGMDGEITFDEKTDKAGPLTVGVTLTREVPRETEADAAIPKPAGADAKSKTITQRIVAIGDADFIDDANVGALGNKQLGLNIIQWLATRDSMLNVDVPKAPDTTLNLSGLAQFAIGVLYALLIPVLLVVFGVARWLIRRRK
jgi:ABC-type uncharacterized transport system involved in gliding motility auxiliary subunit